MYYIDRTINKLNDLIEESVMRARRNDRVVIKIAIDKFKNREN